jgi:predicted permease
MQQLKEERRGLSGWNGLDNAAQDLKFALRQLRRTPLFALTSILVLALGVAASVTMFGFVDAALIRPLPYDRQDRLLAAFVNSNGDPRSIVAYWTLADWKRLNHAFASIDAYALNGGFTLTTRSGAEQASGTRVSAGFFRTLGVHPILGRDFRPADDSPGAPHTAVLSYAAWQKRFGGKPDVLGKTVTLNGSPTTIIGILPSTFQFGLYGGADFWGNLRSDGPCEQSRNCNNLIAIARLKDGVSINAASAEMDAIVHRLRAQYPDAYRGVTGTTLLPLRELIVGDIRPILLLLLTGAGILLLIAAANVTTLLLARSEKRQREIAVRGALGASSARLFQQFAVEGFVLAALAGLCALFFADLGARFLTSLVPPDKLASMPFLDRAGLNPLSVLFACALCLLAAVAFALIPAARASLAGIIEGLKQGVRGSTGHAWRRIGSKLVVFEVALALVLMVGAGLLAKSIYLMLHLDLGFNPSHLAVVQLSWPPGAYDSDEQQITLAHQIVSRLSILPGVQSVGLSLAPPIDSAWGTTSFHIAGRPNRSEMNEVLNRQVTAGYFKTLQARLIRGRYFTEADDTHAPLIAIVNRSLANKYFPGVDPIGKQISYDWAPKSFLQIVGVIDDLKEGPLDGPPLPALYVPFNQTPVVWPAVLVRTSQAPASALSEITRTIHGIDPFLSVFGQQTITERIDQSPSAYLHRSSAFLVGAFAAAAFLLSVIGLYGVVAYSVSQRTREIGIHMALGAHRNSVYRLILKEAGRMVAFGIGLGFACSIAASSLMRSLLFGVRSLDAQMWTGAAVLLASAALVATYLPARRAALVNPVEALRAE